MNDKPLTLQEAKTMPLGSVRDVKTLLLNQGALMQLQSVASKHLNPERLMRVLASAIRSTPGLQRCEPMTFLGALMQCASLGLEPNTSLGHAYLIPFNRRRKGQDGKWFSVPEVQLIIGYKGYKALAQRSGQVANMHADVVYDDDVKFSHAYGSNQHLDHIPGPRLGKKLGAYFFIRLADGQGQGHVYMTESEILRIRNKSQGWMQAVTDNKTASSPWVTDEDAMWAKTAVRRLAQSGDLPMTTEVIEATRTDEGNIDFRGYAMTPAQDLRGALPMPYDDDEVTEEDPEPAQAAPEDAPPRTRPPAQRTNRTREPDKAPPPRKEADPRDAARQEPPPRKTDEREPTMDLGEPDAEDDFKDPPPREEAPREPQKPAERDPHTLGLYRGVKADVEAMGEQAAYSLHGEDIAAIRSTMPVLYYVLWQLMPEEVPISAVERDAGSEAVQKLKEGN